MATPSTTPFAQKVYQATRQIPEGKVSTYKLIAEAIGQPKAYRAVGSALAKNPFAPEVPCHRVIASDGTIGGFFGVTDQASPTVQAKVKLLQSEGISFNARGKIVSFSQVLFTPSKV